MATVLKCLCLSSIFVLSVGTVFVEDTLYPDYEQRRIDIEDRLPFADIPSEKREVSSPQFEKTAEQSFADVSDYEDSSYLKGPFSYGMYEENYNQFPRKIRQKTSHIEMSRMGRLRDKFFSNKKQKKKFSSYKGNLKDQPSANSNEEEKENLSKPRYLDVIPGLNEISV